MTPTPRDRLLHRWFSRAAAEHRDRTAIVYEKTALTYAELEERSNQLAHHLLASGVKRGDRVALRLERSPELAIGMLGTLKAGACVVALDASDPEERLRYILEDAGAKRELTAESLDRDRRKIARRPQTAPTASTAHVRAGDLAFIFYTTGSTGRPKGVMIPHAARADRLAWELASYRLQPNDVTLLKSSTSFGRVVKELFWPLCSGSKLIIARPNGQADPTYLVELIQTHAITFATLVPSLIAMLLEEPRFTASTSLRLILSEGEPLASELSNRFLARTRCALYNPYGLTEISTATLHVCKPNEPGRVVSIGHPLGLTARILDERGRKVPDGETGELYLSGPGIASGYLGRADLTAERFTVHDGMPTYRTGDLVSRTGSGELMHLGRADRQVKLRGFRVELGEIEGVLLEHEAVQQAVVLLREDKADDKRLVAYVVLRRAIAKEELRAHLAKKLAAFLVPAHIEVLDAFPLTPNGKVDKHALPAPSIERAKKRPGARARTRTKHAREMAEIFARVLGAESVGESDDFFMLGGHSMTALSLMNEIEQHFGKRLPLATLLRAPTVEALCRELAQTPAWSSFVYLNKNGSEVPFTCVHGLYGNVLCFRELAQRLGTERPFYALQAAGLDGSLEPDASIEEMAARYLRELRARQPRGPYLLGGYSFGGVVAYAMACELSRAGEDVPLLALLDTLAPELQRGSLPFFHTAYVTRGGRLSAIDRSWSDDGVSFGMREVADDPQHLQRRVERAALRASRAFRPEVYRGRAVLFRTTFPESPRDLEPRFGWGRLVPELEICDIPGEHTTMLSAPWVDHLAAALDARLPSRGRRGARARKRR